VSENGRTPDDVEEDDDLTRRAWLLRLGEVTALAGVAGLVPDLAAAISLTGQSKSTRLPPGLYEPSAEHLTHVLAARDAPVVPRGAETDYAAPLADPYQPGFFSQHELEVVTRLAGILLGNVDARALSETIAWIDLRLQRDDGIRQAARSLEPLHRTLAVAYYGQTRVANLETTDWQAIVRTGLKDLETRSREQYGQEFLGLAEAAQTEIVRDISRMPEDSPLGRCYLFIRREAVRGYFTSQAGLKDLDYKGNAFYGACPGCESKGI
jgi:Gluconate 2-dehydrogenase subunit 3